MLHLLNIYFKQLISIYLDMILFYNQNLHMWKVGLNKSQVSYSPKSSLENHQKNNKIFCPTMSRDESTSKTQAIKKSHSKSSVHRNPKINGKESEERSKSNKCSRKNSESHSPDNQNNTDEKATDAQNQFCFLVNLKALQKKQKGQQETFSQTNKNPLKKVESIIAADKMSVGVQTETTLINKSQGQSNKKVKQNIYERDSLLENQENQKKEILFLRQKTLKLEKVNNLYELKIVQLQIYFNNLRCQILKKLKQQKKSICQLFTNMQMFLCSQVVNDQIGRIESKPLIWKCNRCQIVKIPKRLVLSPEKYVNKIIQKIEMLKQQSTIRIKTQQQSPKSTLTRSRAHKLSFPSRLNNTSKNKTTSISNFSQQKTNI